MGLGQIYLGDVPVSRMIIGGNPFSGFSHQTEMKDREMCRYFTTQRIKDTLRRAESLGVNTHLGRADHHIIRVLLEYWDEGGSIQWIAQTCPEVGDIPRGIQNGIRGGAKACYVHGGVMDFRFAQNQLDDIPDAIAMIHDAGLPAGIAGHNPEVFEWAEDHLELDFYMCSYYNSANRDKDAEMRSGTAAWFRPEDRERMATLIQELSKPVIHYKVMAAGRNDPKEALAFVAQHLRPQDAVCIGIYPHDKPDMLEEDIALLEESLRKTGKLDGIAAE
ncbi:MAG: hypothetical protein R6V12_16855 [Candidatus Hydrogenedentota bacterium]